tara:strand:- start:856 stop:1119 length:264 start_codon:yes stop_codon:yes gene_type:complete
MKWIIVVLMALYNPQPNKDDAVVMLSADNKPLIFTTIDDCREYATMHYVNIVTYANMLFKGEGITREVICVKEPKKNNRNGRNDNSI